MLTLAFDTTAEFGSLALADETGVRQEILVHAPEGFGQVLFPRIQALLEAQSVSLSDIQLLAAASGPGSFTGVRVGLAAMKGLASVLGVPVAAVSNLAALAEFGTGPLRAALIDARRGEVYAALYGASAEPVIPESVLSFPRLLERLTEELERHSAIHPARHSAIQPDRHSAIQELEWISADFAPFRAALAGTRFEKFPVAIAPRALAGAIARIAIRRALAGETRPNAAVEANYVRKSDAELLWKPR
jgi:tRNA threonylcarbamoyladenosine biosynthesis protein TsaB